MTTTFTNFCCRSGGSNLNAGTRTGDTTEPATAAALTYASGTWVQSTCVFTVASGNPITDGVAAGDYASVFPDAAVFTPFVGRVTGRDATTITVSTTVKAGTAPVNGTTNTTLKIGGAWKGPNAAEGFPLNIGLGALKNAGGNGVRVNFKNDATYSITAKITQSVSGPATYQGYTSSYGDGGRAILDGGTSGTSYNLIDNNLGNDLYYVDFQFQNNGASASAHLINSSSRVGWARCVFTGSRGNGLVGGSTINQCEAYGNNLANASACAGFKSGQSYINCISHDNSGSHSSGFILNTDIVFPGSIINSIADTNGEFGISFQGVYAGAMAINCDAYNNGSDGINTSGGGGPTLIQNCNLFKNTGYGINSAATLITGLIKNCGFGVGTGYANSGGTVTMSASCGLVEIGSITYPSGINAWVDPANGDFRINLAQAKGAGFGTFLQTAASYAGTVGYPDIGAAHHLEVAGGGLMINPGLSGGLR